MWSDMDYNIDVYCTLCKMSCSFLVTASDDVIEGNEEIEPDKSIGDIRAEPLSLPAGFCWDTLDIGDPLIVSDGCSSVFDCLPVPFCCLYFMHSFCVYSVVIVWASYPPAPLPSPVPSVFDWAESLTPWTFVLSLLFLSVSLSLALQVHLSFSVHLFRGKVQLSYVCCLIQVHFQLCSG